MSLTSPPFAEQRKNQYKSVSEKDYPAWTVEWMGLLWDKLTSDGSVLIVIRPHISNGMLSDYVLRTRLALRDDGWTECEELIWLKPGSPPLGSTHRPTAELGKHFVVWQVGKTLLQSDGVWAGLTPYWFCRVASVWCGRETVRSTRAKA